MNDSIFDGPEDAPDAVAAACDRLGLDLSDDEDRECFSEQTDMLIIPDQLWLLWSDNPDRPGQGHWVPTNDDAPGGPTFLLSFGEAESLAAADHQLNTYGVACRPVRVK
jgi:hypothetical protein